MPSHTNASQSRREATGTTQLPLSRVKKIIHVDQDIATCSNNAAFLIAVAAELFVQKLAEESHNEAKLERKPRKNVQYKDVANAISHHDYLEFLEDVAPKTVSYKKIKSTAFATQARLRGELGPGDEAAAGRPSTAQSTGGAGPGSANTSPKMIMNGDPRGAAGAFSVPPRVENDATRVSLGAMMTDDDPSEQLAQEMMQAKGRDGDVDMTG